MPTKSLAKKAASKVLENQNLKAVRRPRTLSLDDRLFGELKQYCALKGLTVSEVVDALILEFLEQAKSKN